MLTAVLFGLAASSALVIGALIGNRFDPPKQVTGVLLAFASGALISALAFELFEEAFELGGATRAGLGLLVGAGPLSNTSAETISLPLAFAAGAVLASLADTLMPEAYEKGGPLVALSTTAGFVLSFVLATL